MAQVVNKFPEGFKLRKRNSGAGAKPKWNYKQYMDGQIWKLIIGEDVPKDRKQIQTGFYDTAKDVGGWAIVWFSPTYKYVYVKLMPKETEQYAKDERKPRRRKAQQEQQSPFAKDDGTNWDQPFPQSGSSLYLP